MRATLQKRSTRRSRVFLAAVLEVCGSSQEVRIRDVSREGALVETPTPLKQNEDVGLFCGESALAGRVVWVDGVWCGIDFLEPLSGTLVDYIGNKLKVSAQRTYRHDRVEAEDRDGANRIMMQLRNRLH
jgi:hypothetical protein